MKKEGDDEKATIKTALTRRKKKKKNNEGNKKTSTKSYNRKDNKNIKIKDNQESEGNEKER